MKYKLKKHLENIGGLQLTIETLEDLDAVINELCEKAPPPGSHEARLLEDLCPYFGVVWPAARALSAHVARMSGWLKGKKVLEVGCGLALPSLVAAKAGARVTATDFHRDVPEFLERNLKHNDVSVEFINLDWRKTAEVKALGKFDFIIGSDIAYEAGQADFLATTLATLCHKESHIVLADPGRPYFQSLVDAIEKHSFQSDLFVTNVLDSHSDRAGDKPTKEVFVVSFQKI